MQPLNTQMIGDFLYSLSFDGKADDQHYATMDTNGNMGVEGSRWVKQSDDAHTFALRINNYMDRMAALEERVQDKTLECPLGERSVNKITRQSGWSYSVKHAAEVVTKLREHPLHEIQNLRDKLTKAVFDKDKDDVRHYTRLLAGEAKRFVNTQESDMPAFTLMAVVLNQCTALISEACRQATGQDSRSVYEAELQIIFDKIGDIQSEQWKSGDRARVYAYVEGMGEAETSGNGIYQESLPTPSPLQSQAAVSSYSSQAVTGPAAITTPKGKELLDKIRDAYTWKDSYDGPTTEFLGRMNGLYFECRNHMTELCKSDAPKPFPEHQREADALCKELTELRNHWGRKLLPLEKCNSFLRERIDFQDEDGKKYRVDCAQFFEPVAVNRDSAPSGKEDLVKLNRFSVYDLKADKITQRYYLEKNDDVQPNHVLCLAGSQLQRYGEKCPDYWSMREAVLQDMHDRLGARPS
ncbi:MAG: hypothetical protein ACR2PT_12835 [Endozoicomonas sp.]